MSLFICFLTICFFLSFLFVCFFSGLLLIYIYRSFFLFPFIFFFLISINFLLCFLFCDFYHFLLFFFCIEARWKMLTLGWWVLCWALFVWNNCFFFFYLSILSTHFPDEGRSYSSFFLFFPPVIYDMVQFLGIQKFCYFFLFFPSFFSLTNKISFS